MDTFDALDQWEWDQSCTKHGCEIPFVVVEMERDISSTKIQLSNKYQNLCGKTLEGKNYIMEMARLFNETKIDSHVVCE